MSYNITRCKLSRVDDFQIPINMFYPKTVNKSYHPYQDINDEGKTIFQFTDCHNLVGIVDEEGFLHVEKFDISGEGSGRVYFDIISPALKQSKGNIEYVLVWEGGDEIDSVVVKDGVISENSLI